jgi:hypothetical protein
VRKELLEVITVRTWKEYVEESVLIVFSVVLALLLTTLFQKLTKTNKHVKYCMSCERNLLPIKSQKKYN